MYASPVHTVADPLDGGINKTDAINLPSGKAAMLPVWRCPSTTTEWRLTCGRGDNEGPPPAEEVQSNFDYIKSEYPGAKLVASSLDEFWELLEAEVDSLPVVTEEIGDTWCGRPCASALTAVQDLRCAV